MLLVDAGAEGSQSIFDGIDEGWRAHDHAALSNSTEVDLGILWDGLDEVHLDSWNRCCAWQYVVKKSSREKIPGLVIGALFEQDRTDTVRYTTAGLTFHDGRIDRHTTVQRDYVSLDVDEARIDVNFDDRRMAAARPPALPTVVDVLDLKVQTHVIGQGAALTCRRNQRGEGYLTGGVADYANLACGNLNLFGTRL